MNWTRTSKCQRDMLREFHRANNKQLCVRPNKYRTMMALIFKGYLESTRAGVFGIWCNLTKRGEDYLRFGVRGSRGNVRTKSE